MLKRLARMRVGVIGHPYKWMTDVMSNQLQLFDELGVVVDYVEESELAAAVRGLERDPAVAELVESLSRSHRVQNLSEETFTHSVRYAVALRKVVRT